MTPFRRTKQNSEFSRSVVYAVHGFWSGDSVRVDQSVDHKDKEWKAPTINWSCGGRDGKQEPDDVVAVECFSKAIADAVKVAKRWRKGHRERPGQNTP
jgi:hypothetical protein